MCLLSATTDHPPRSSLAAGSESHKNLKDEWPILRFYYTAPYALFWVCTFNETFLGAWAVFCAANETRQGRRFPERVPLHADPPSQHFCFSGRICRRYRPSCE